MGSRQSRQAEKIRKLCLHLNGGDIVLGRHNLDTLAYVAGYKNGRSLKVLLDRLVRERRYVRRVMSTGWRNTDGIDRYCWLPSFMRECGIQLRRAELQAYDNLFASALEMREALLDDALTDHVVVLWEFYRKHRRKSTRKIERRVMQGLRIMSSRFDAEETLIDSLLDAGILSCKRGVWYMNIHRARQTFDLLALPLELYA